MVDVVIIGSGVAALSCAINLPSSYEVLLVTKDAKKGANSYWAQGGVAVALDEQDVSSHIKDTIEAGAKRNNVKAVELLSSKSREIIDSLIKIGMEFDKTKDGLLHYTKEGAHSQNRILHAGGDATGKALNTFLAHKNSHAIKLSSVVDLLIKGDVCYGLRVVEPTGEFKNIYAKVVVIASGGMGGLFLYSTNAGGIDANLQGIAIKRQIALRDMHMLQFHPTVFVKNEEKQKFLLSEALRGEGAKLIDQDGFRFMEIYDKEKMELASRDVISRSIFMHQQTSAKDIFLDLRGFSKSFFEERFPTISAKLASMGFDAQTMPIPISPAFHYAMGGITTDLNAKVIGFKNLYAIGEVASTMVHGANRLASNSLLESLVFGKIAAEKIKSQKLENIKKEFKIKEFKLTKNDDKDKDAYLKKLMWDKVGIIRNEHDLDTALMQVNQMLSQKCGYFLELKLLVAKATITHAIEHNQSQGAHFIQNS